MPKTTPSTSPKCQPPTPALISIDDLYAAPVPVPCTLETAKGPVEVVMQVSKDRISVDFMSRMFDLAEKAKELAGDEEESPEATKAMFDSLTPWIGELVTEWNLAAPPTEHTARSLGISVLTRLVAAIQGTSQTDSDDPENPNV